MVDGKKIYSWSRCPPNCEAKIDAQVAGEELERIRREHNGKLFPPDIIDAAEPASSPLHPMFSWDNDDAARKYRLLQARHLAGSLTFVIVSTKTIPENIRELVKRDSTPAYVSIKNPVVGTQNQPRTRTYVPVDEAMSNPATRDEILNKALRELEFWQNKYRMYQELAEVFKAIEKTKHKLEAKA